MNVCEKERETIANFPNPFSLFPFSRFPIPIFPISHLDQLRAEQIVNGRASPRDNFSARERVFVFSYVYA